MSNKITRAEVDELIGRLNTMIQSAHGVMDEDTDSDMVFAAVMEVREHLENATSILDELEDVEVEEDNEEEPAE